MQDSHNKLILSEMISLLHPSRSRVDKSYKTCWNWFARAVDIKCELIISLDRDDPQQQQYEQAMKELTGPNFYTIAITNPNRSAVDAINAAAKVATGDIMIVLSDDTDCPDNWAELIEEEVRGKKDFVLRVEDGIQSWLVTMPVFDRTYYNRFGYVYNPGYLHQFCDTEFTHVACGLHKLIRSNLSFPHLHYSVKRLGIKPDEINHRADRTTTQGRDLYLERFKKGFDLPNFDVWDFKDADHYKWLKHHLR